MLVLVLFNVVAIAIELMILSSSAIVEPDRPVVFRRPWIVFAKSGENSFDIRSSATSTAAAAATSLSAPIGAGSSPRRATGDDWMIDVVVCP